MKKSSYRIIKETETFTGKENYFVEWKFLFFGLGFMYTTAKQIHLICYRSQQNQKLKNI